MDTNTLQNLIDNFEKYKQVTIQGIEFWLARDLQLLLGYSKRDNFFEIIQKAKISCNNNKKLASDHFADVGKMVSVGSGAEREIQDIVLTRYACYLIAQNGDPRKTQIAFAQSYFATQTRKLELIQEKLELYERIVARKKLSESESELSRIIFEQTGNEKNFGIIRSKGDIALFGTSTQNMKLKRGIKSTEPLADYMPTILLKAKDFATEITIYNSKQNNLTQESQISKEHITNNKTVRDTLIKRGITPEKVEPVENIKKVERKLTSQAKKILE